MSACVSSLAFFFGASPKWRDLLDSPPFLTNISTWSAICTGPQWRLVRALAYIRPSAPGAGPVRYRIGDRP